MCPGEARCGNPHAGFYLGGEVQGQPRLLPTDHTINHPHFRCILDQRVRDGVSRRTIDKWLNAGVLEHGGATRPETGVPQGAGVGFSWRMSFAIPSSMRGSSRWPPTARWGSHPLPLCRRPGDPLRRRTRCAAPHDGPPKAARQIWSHSCTPPNTGDPLYPPTYPPQGQRAQASRPVGDV